MTNTEKTALEARIDELCAEVERLHADQWGEGFNAGCDAANAALEESVEHYKAENEKLRELVSIAGIYCANGLCGKDDGCPLYIGKPYCAFPDRMRELGVDG